MRQIQSKMRKILDDFQVDPERGFLPSADPLKRLPSNFQVWEDAARELPKLLAAGRIRPVLRDMPVLNVDGLRDEPEFQRAMLLLSYFGHAYAWGIGSVPDHIPAPVAIPWHGVAEKLGRPPVLSYASYALNNWRRIDPDGPISLGNIVLLQNFLGGIDEEWFILVHVEIEAKAAPLLVALVEAQEAVREKRSEDLKRHLTAVATNFNNMYATLERMVENCDPYIYFHRVRPYIHGWKDHPALPDGMVYEGVGAYAGKPQQFRGETGAQSSIIPSIDAALGVMHKDDPLRPYLMEMRNYMPPRHRAFIDALEDGPSIRSHVIENRSQNPGLLAAYNDCIRMLERFRSKHLEYAAGYVHKQSLQSPYNPTERGTGGTPFIPYLKKHRDETTEHIIR